VGLPTDSWRQGDLGGEVVEDELDDGDQNRTPEMSLRVGASVMAGLHEIERKRAHDNVRKDHGTKKLRKKQTRGHRVDGAHWNPKTLPAVVADCGGGSRAAWGLPR
jgi:hypothetical protein